MQRLSQASRSRRVNRRFETTAVLMQFARMGERQEKVSSKEPAAQGEYGHNHRLIFYPAPPEYNMFGYHHKHGYWKHYICVMDDFGNTVAVSGFHYGWAEEILEHH